MNKQHLQLIQSIDPQQLPATEHKHTSQLFLYSTLSTDMNTMTLWSSQLWISTLFQLLLTSLQSLLFITIQRIHTVHSGHAEASQWKLIAGLAGAELEGRKGNHRIVAVGAMTRDTGTEWGSANHAFDLSVDWLKTLQMLNNIIK